MTLEVFATIIFYSIATGLLIGTFVSLLVFIVLAFMPKRVDKHVQND